MNKKELETFAREAAKRHKNRKRPRVYLALGVNMEGQRNYWTCSYRE
ncbi:MAG: hypothetical protein V3V31_05175 [Methylococcales bacterium]